MDLVGGSEASTSRAIDKLVSLQTEESRSFSGGERAEVQSVKEELESIRDFIRVANARSVDEELSNEVKIWLKQAKEVAEVIEDVVDEYVLKASQGQAQRGVVSFIDGVGRLNSRRKLSSDIRNVKEMLREIQGQGQRNGIRDQVFHNRDIISDRYNLYCCGTRHPHLRNSAVGIDSVAYELIEWLAEGEPRRSLISIVGVGGVGKTTLVEEVYYHFKERTRYDYAVEGRRFDCYAWIAVRASYNMEAILIEMVRQMRPAVNPVGRTEEELIDTLRRYLQSRKYLVVFDDVWQVEFWENVKHALPDNGQGSRIMITTRCDAVSAFCKNTSFHHAYRMEPLTEKMSWNLFCSRAFPHEEDRRYFPELAQLSLEFMRMCLGLPRAIVAVAGFLSTKEKSRSEWQRIHDNFKFEIESEPELAGISKVLVLSFRDLPYQLKMCFLCFSIFPEDYLIPNDKLFKLWIAEDFVRPTELKTSEQVAEEYLNELIQRNLVQACPGFYGIENFCRVPDAMRQIIRQEADELGFCQIRDANNSSSREKSRRLSLSNNIEEHVLDTIEGCQVRSIFLSNISALSSSFLVTLLRKYKLLTLLDFENVPLNRLPEEVGNLFHLKYLNLKNTKVKRLPKSVGKLQNLQTLDVRNTLLVELPIEINMLQNLQHLLVGCYGSNITSNSTRGVRVKKGIGYLENLQTLMTVEAGLIGIGLEEELEKLTGLRSLGISRLTAEVASDLCPSIEKMNHLEYLSLHAMTDYEILDLQPISSPPLFLQRLVLRGRLQRLPTWISSLQILSVLCLSLSKLTDDPLRQICVLPNLVSLWLYRAYEGEQLHFGVGGFRKLKLLVLRDMKGLQVVEIEEGALPVLEELRIGPSPLLHEVPSGVQHLRSLQVLAFYDMPNEFVQSMQPGGGDDYVNVEHVPYVLFWYRVQGRNYALYKLGDSDLLDRLQGLATNSVNDVVQHNLGLSFCYSDDEANSASASTSVAPWARDRPSFSSGQLSFFSDDIED